MTNEQIRIEIAKLCGYHVEKVNGSHHLIGPDGKIVGPPLFYLYPLEAHLHRIPNYPESLDACASFEATIRDDNSLNGMVAYCNTLMQVCGSHRECVTSAPLQRCHAFLKLHGKWVAE